MNQEKQRTLLVGLSFFGQELLRGLSSTWDVIALEKDSQRIARAKEEFPDAEFLNGAADSVLTWKKVDFTRLKYIVSTLKDTDINVELCRIIREVLGQKLPIIILTFRKIDEKLFEPYKATLLNPLNPAIQAVAKKMDKNLLFAVNIGLEKGELLEVAIRAKSHLVDRKLKFLRPSMWHISAVYRDGSLIMPDGDSALKVGDRVVLVGEPKILENVTNILLKGDPQFPLQYGTDIVFPLHVKCHRNIDEAIYWLNSFKANRIQFLPFKKNVSPAFAEKIKKEVSRFKIGQSIEMFKEIFSQSLNTGVLVVPADSQSGWMKMTRIRESFKKSSKPFLLSRLSFPYEGVIISFNGPDPGMAMESGLEIAKLLEVPFRVVYVTLPREMRGREEGKEIRNRKLIVSDFEGIYKRAIDFTIIEGNPVLETLKYLSPLKNQLLVITSNPKAAISFFKPNIPYLLAKKTHLSALVIPGTQADE
ncbi:MAG: trk/ktr system potassium uptake protein [Acidobacteriota bacterium]|nr:trk/ktr system potassium uptake protein [Acidobacteriota bacterium]